MDWYSWLSKSSGLDPGIIYEYSVLLSHNQLEEDDIVHFDHEFLQSMGIAIAKHRLEILKLAKKERRRRSLRPVAALVTALRRAHRYFHSMAHHESKAVVALPAPSYGIGRWRVNKATRSSRRLVITKQESLLITDGIHSGVKVVHSGGSPPLRSMSPMVLCQKEGNKEEGFWTGKPNAEEMRWESMFEGLKPT